MSCGAEGCGAASRLHTSDYPIAFFQEVWMPTYEYACRDCGQHVEVVQSFRDAALTTCGTCRGRLRKVFSAAGIIFKGSGYYVTDSRTAAKANSGGKNGEAGPAKESTTPKESRGESTGESTGKPTGEAKSGSAASSEKRSSSSTSAKSA